MAKLDQIARPVRYAEDIADELTDRSDTVAELAVLLSIVRSTAHAVKLGCGSRLQGEGSSVSQQESPFDRELAQYEQIAERMDRRVRELHQRGRQRLTSSEWECLTREIDTAENEASEIRSMRAQYIRDRDHLIEIGCDSGQVLPGSIVTVQWEEALYTFVLTSRNVDSSYPTEGYRSLLGESIRLRRVGETVTLADWTDVVIRSVKPGFPIAESDWSSEPPSLDSAERWLAEQRCRDNHYVAALNLRLTEPHVAEINDYVQRLRVEHNAPSIPFVSPTYGGVRARLLTLLQDPGPKTDSASTAGSGMLCVENYDLTAARQKYFLNEAGIDVSQIISWNAYPWPLPKKPNAETDREAAEALGDLLALCSQLNVVILNGVVAKRVWETLQEMEPGIVEGIVVLPTYHTSAAVIANPKLDPAAVNDDLSAKYARAAELLHVDDGARIELEILVTSTFPDEEIERRKVISVIAPSAQELADDNRLGDWANEQVLPYADADDAEDDREVRTTVEVVDAPPGYAKLGTLYFEYARSGRNE